MTPYAPDRLLQIGIDALSVKVLLTAVELGVFSELGKGPRSNAQLRAALGMSERAAPDFLDTLVAMGFLEREGDDEYAIYVNTRESGALLDRRSEDYAGDLLELANRRLSEGWDHLSESVRSGRPSAALSDATRGKFSGAWERVMACSFRCFVDRFDWSGAASVTNIGGNGLLSRMLAERHPYLDCRSISVLHDPVPWSDIALFGTGLHGATLEHRQVLIRLAFEALTPGGRLVVIAPFIDDARRKHLPGLLLSLNVLVEGGDPPGFTPRDFDGWCVEAGFSRTDIMPLSAMASAGVAYK